jgi:hypothetical protein
VIEHKILGSNWDIRGRDAIVVEVEHEEEIRWFRKRNKWTSFFVVDINGAYGRDGTPIEGALGEALKLRYLQMRAQKLYSDVLDYANGSYHNSVEEIREEG